MFIRKPNPNRTFAEARPMLPIEVINVLDAECSVIARRTGKPKSREALIVDIVTRWAVERHEEASVIVALCAGNPPTVDSEEAAA